jgi:dienelactone hydrolase
MRLSRLHEGEMTTKERSTNGPTLTVTPAAGLIDEPLRVLLRGLQAGGAVTVRAHLLDARGVLWSSRATFVADGGGTVDLTTHAPVSGTYSGVDGEGLIASLAVAGGVASRPFDGSSVASLPVEFVAEVSGRSVASATVRRLYLADDVETTVVGERGLSGLFFHQKYGEPRPGVIVLGGSAGALTFASQVAGLLASHGFASLALAYFAANGLPEHLIEIPLEYFATALEWLSSQPIVRSDAIGVVGRSRGAELALILGSRFSSIRSVVAYCPSSVVWNGLRSDTIADAAAWTESGRPIPFIPLTEPSLSALRAHLFSAAPVTLSPLFEAALAGPRQMDISIAVERTKGPILLISGRDDQMWPAARMGDEIVERLAVHHHPFHSSHCCYPGAGHLMRPPGVSTSGLHGKFAFGGDGPAQARANRAAWSETLAFLATSLGLSSRIGAASAAGG